MIGAKASSDEHVEKTGRFLYYELGLPDKQQAIWKKIEHSKQAFQR